MGSKSKYDQPEATAQSARAPGLEDEQPISKDFGGQDERPTSTTRVGETTAPTEDAHELPTLDGEETLRTSPPNVAEVQSLPGSVKPGLRYQELRRIASGSTSVVNEAFDWTIRRRVALKQLHVHLVESEVAGRFRRERLIAAWLDHPNILPVYDFIDLLGGAPALIMKFIQGRNLAEEIRDSGSGLEEIYKLLSTLSKVGDAIHFAHQAGVIHGDLKPQNIMVGVSGEAYVMDWGIARFRPDVERELSELLTEENIPFETEVTAGIYGTPAYMAPEQVQGNSGVIDERTDVFGLGAILYQILTGVSVYEGASVAAILEKATRVEIIPPRKRCPSRPIRPDLDALCMRALARHPEDRFQTAGRFVEALRTTMMSGSWFELRTYRPGDVIVRQGDPSNEAFLIERGECEVTQMGPGGEESFLRVLRPGDAFGETGVFVDSPRTASVIAIGDVQVQCIDRQSLKWTIAGGGPLGVLVQALANRFIEREQELYSLVPPSRQD